MSIPGDNYDYDFLNRLSESIEHLYTNPIPNATDVTVRQFFFRSLKSAIKSGMLPGMATETLLSNLQPLAEKKIQQLTPAELLRIKSLLKSQQQDTDSGVSPPPPSSEPLLATASKTTSWVEIFFSIPSPFLPNFTSFEPPEPVLTANERAFLDTILQENGFDSLQAFLDARSQAQNACPRSYKFTEDQLQLISSLLSPENLRSSLEHGVQGLPRQFEKDNIDSLRASFLSIDVDGQSYALDSEEHVQSFIEAIAAKSSGNDVVKDLMLLVGTQTLLNCVMQGKSDLAIAAQEATNRLLQGNNEPSLVRLHNVKSTQDQISFKADLTYRFSSGLKLKANTDADAAKLSSILNKLGCSSVFSAEIKARFQGTVNTRTGSSSLAILNAPQVSITR